MGCNIIDYRAMCFLNLGMKNTLNVGSKQNSKLLLLNFGLSTLNSVYIFSDRERFCFCVLLASLPTLATLIAEYASPVFTSLNVSTAKKT